MKKVLMLLAATTLLAGPAFGAIQGSKHDLKAGGYQTGASTETCVYCHTPHGADTSVSKAPLWNRDLTGIAVSAVYAGANLNSTITTATADATDALLCLSCHDGASMTVGLVNPPNDATFIDPPSGNIPGASSAVLDDDLSNDHPIGFSYNAALVTADGGLNAKAAVEATAGMAGALSYDTDKMWCSSCHDVHDDTNAPFLRVSNAGSGLCTTCHNK
jgi:predicted CXXCH cytochrome family protein